MPSDQKEGIWECKKKLLSIKFSIYLNESEKGYYSRYSKNSIVNLGSKSKNLGGTLSLK